MSIHIPFAQLDKPTSLRVRFYVSITFKVRHFDFYVHTLACKKETEYLHLINK